MEALPLDKTGKNKVNSRKDLILKESTRLFRERGYTSTSIRDLAQEVGLEPSSIYSHFKSKEQILKHICFIMANSFMIGLERAEQENTPEERLRRVIREHIQVVLKHKEASAVMWNEWKFLTNSSHDQFRNMIMEYENRFNTIIKEGIKQGTFKKKNPQIVSNLILSSLNSIGYWHSNGKKHQKTNHTGELEKELTEIYLNGILN